MGIEIAGSKFHPIIPQINKPVLVCSQFYFGLNLLLTMQWSYTQAFISKLSKQYRVRVIYEVCELTIRRLRTDYLDVCKSTQQVCELTVCETTPWRNDRPVFDF